MFETNYNMSSDRVLEVFTSAPNGHSSRSHSILLPLPLSYLACFPGADVMYFALKTHAAFIKQMHRAEVALNMSFVRCRLLIAYALKEGSHK